MAQKKMDEKSESLKVLESRLESMKPGDDPNGYVFYVSEEIKDMEGLNETETKVAAKIADIMKLKIDVLTEMLTGGYYKIKIAKKDDITNQEFELEKEVYQKIASLDVEGKLSVVDGEFQYRGKMTWHQVVGKMIRMGFEQEPEFDKLCQSNSYDSHEENKSTEMNLGNGIVAKSDEGFVDMGNGVFGIPPSDSVSETPVSAKSTSTEITFYSTETLPEGTKILKMDDYHKIPTAVLRDLKIDKIIK
jgi:hypothetical protein